LSKAAKLITVVAAGLLPSFVALNIIILLQNKKLSLRRDPLEVSDDCTKQSQLGREYNHAV
jgi:hypothetical protein